VLETISAAVGSPPPASQADVVVFGGGQSALAVAYYLRRTTLTTIVLDSGERAGARGATYVAVAPRVLPGAVRLPAQPPDAWWRHRLPGLREHGARLTCRGSSTSSCFADRISAFDALSIAGRACGESRGRGNSGVWPDGRRTGSTPQSSPRDSARRCGISPRAASPSLTGESRSGHAGRAGASPVGRRVWRLGGLRVRDVHRRGPLGRATMDDTSRALSEDPAHERRGGAE